MIISTTSQYVTFYTCNGRHNFNFSIIDKMLDPKAPKPKPIYYKIKYWPDISFGKFLGLNLGTKGQAGYFIIFYDKNGNRVKSYRANSFKEVLQYKNFDLDISKLKNTL